MRVGSLHSPREYDGRPPPDVGYYLDLVIPRKEEPRKKISHHVRLLHGRISRNRVINLQSIYQNISKFTSKTNQIRIRGAMGDVLSQEGRGESAERRYA